MLQKLMQSAESVENNLNYLSRVAMATDHPLLVIVALSQFSGDRQVVMNAD